MNNGVWLLAAALLGLVPGLGAAEGTPHLHVYGPGGPHHVIEECARLFQQSHGIPVQVVRASPKGLAQHVPRDGDVYFGGAEFMLEDFDRENPGVLDLTTVATLPPRRIGIVVRKGNPLNIVGPDCLRRDEVDLLLADLEDMEDFAGLPDGEVLKRPRLVRSGADGVDAWRSAPTLDAWVTYRSWHVWMEGESDFVEIPGSKALRHTVAALTKRTPHREAAARFLSFLNSPQGRKVFQEHGWD